MKMNKFVVTYKQYKVYANGDDAVKEHKRTFKNYLSRRAFIRQIQKRSDVWDIQETENMENE